MFAREKNSTGLGEEILGICIAVSFPFDFLRRRWKLWKIWDSVFSLGRKFLGEKLGCNSFDLFHLDILFIFYFFFIQLQIYLTCLLSFCDFIFLSTQLYDHNPLLVLYTQGSIKKKKGKIKIHRCVYIYIYISVCVVRIHAQA